MKPIRITCILLIASGMIYLTSCDNNVGSSLEESVEIYTDLNPIAEASNATATINRFENAGGNSWFKVQLDNIGSNSTFNNGTVGAWCLEWEKPLKSNNDVHKGVKLYSTEGNNKWKPLNYLFAIKPELERNDPSLTVKEFQAAIWTLAGDIGIASEFDLDKLADSDLPSRLMKDGKVDFSKSKAKSIVERVRSGYASFKAKDDGSGFIAETEGDEQDVFIPEEPSDPCDEDIIDFDKVDVMLLFDDTGSFAGNVDDVAALFPDIINTLETAFPDKDFAFGVSRFEDYGGPGTGFSSENSTGRPFILNQPLVTQSVAGSESARNMLITDALERTAPGFGGDGPETALHALYELATGDGFDGNGNANTTDSGNAGSNNAQTTPGTSGDVPAFSTNTLPTSGTLGGAGWRTDAQKMVIIATDVCSVASLDDTEDVPDNITGQPGTSEAISRLICSNLVGTGRYGFVSDAKTTAANSVANAVVPSGAPTIQETIDALTSFGIQVIGLSTTGGATADPGPSFSPSVFLSALANLTGGVDDDDNPLVFAITANAESIAAAIVDAVGTSACDAEEDDESSKALIRDFSSGMRDKASTSAADDTTRYSNYKIFD